MSEVSAIAERYGVLELGKACISLVIPNGGLYYPLICTLVLVRTLSILFCVILIEKNWGFEEMVVWKVMEGKW